MELWNRIRPYLSSLVRFFHISYIEAKSEHSGTRLGILWAPLSSLIFSALLALVFRHSATMSVSEYFIYVFTGYVLWNFISDSITGSTDVIQGQLDFAVHNNLSLIGLFGKLLVDRLFEYSMNVAILIVLILLLRPTTISFGLTLFLPFAAIITLTSLGTAYLVNITTVLYPDLKTAVKVGARFMFFASPVFWHADEVASGTRAFLVQYNPVSYYLSLARQVFGVEPLEPSAWAMAVLVSTAICATGFLAYRQSQSFVRNFK
ncbi:ABC transporter [Mesorhizobium sp. WSM2239]|uniref:ABC transporter n=2 Tax=unclassified Mesorhizobium TaxID=325217 RepID=A0AAU8DGU8_9HYPH